MAELHFVKDYEAHVRALLASHPLDEAMSLAVGGSFEKIGRIELAVLRYAGLRPGMSLIDIGCGSERLAAALAPIALDYLGTDVVQELLDYAATKTPRTFRFIRHTELSLPARDDSADMVCAFSVFTHLQHAETFLYMRDAFRALKPGGTLIFSFLEFAAPTHWTVFESTVMARLFEAGPPLNMFIERTAILAWAADLGFAVDEIIAGTESWHGEILGQSVALLRKPIA